MTPAWAVCLLAATDAVRAQDAEPLSITLVPETALDAARLDPAGARADISGKAGSRPLPDESAVLATLRALPPGFRRSETTHFVVLSDCPIGWTRARETLLERTRHQFLRAAEKLQVKPPPPRVKLLCVLINKHETFRAFGRAHDGLDAGWVAGYYAASANRIVFYNDAASPEYDAVWKQLDDYQRQADDARRRGDAARADGQPPLADRLFAAADDLEGRVRTERSRLRKQAADFSTAKTIHEAVHLLSFNTGLQRRDADYPFWLSEGLASSFETEDPTRAFGPDREGPTARRARLKELALRGESPRVADVVTLSRTAMLEADAAEAMYAVSAGLFSYLYRHERAALTLYLRSLSALAPQRLTPPRHLELFVRHFGDPSIVELRMLAELR
ncbi:MAG: DUF1570 domain-containing protein [Phycisphaerales bacterium]